MMIGIDDNTTFRLLRYLGGEADPREIAALDALLLKDQAARTALIELAWQAQTLRELAAEAPARTRRVPVRTLAAIAACLALLFVVLRRDPSPHATSITASPPRVDWQACFEREVSWNDVYQSVFLYPPSVWSQLLEETPAPLLPFGDDFPLLAESTLPSYARAFDRIRVIPLGDTFSGFDSGAFPAL